MTTPADPMPIDEALAIVKRVAAAGRAIQRDIDQIMAEQNNVTDHNPHDIPSPGQVAEAEVQRLKAALEEIARLPYFYEETAWTWSDISKRQTDIARAALGLTDVSVKKDLER